MPKKSNGWLCNISEDFLSNVFKDNLQRYTVDGVGAADFKVGNLPDECSFIYIDDASYSGTQAALFVEKVRKYISNNPNKQINVAIVIPYMTSHAVEKVTANLSDTNIKIFYSSLIPTIPQLFTKEEDHSRVVNKLCHLFQVATPEKLASQTLTYTDTAVPDDFSTPSRFLDRGQPPVQLYPELLDKRAEDLTPSESDKLDKVYHSYKFIKTGGKPYPNPNLEIEEFINSIPEGSQDDFNKLDF